MKTRWTVFNHDLIYGRDIRIAGVVSLAGVIAAFLFAPQPQIAPYRLRVPAEWELVIENPAPVIYELPKPVVQAPRGVPMASESPEASTIAPNTGFEEFRPDITAPTIETNVPFWKVERKPRLVREVLPDYPEMACAAGIEGKVLVSVVVDTLGHVVSAEVYATSGNVSLDQAALAAARKCGFTPGYQRDRPVVVRNVIMPFSFRLQQ